MFVPKKGVELWLYSCNVYMHKPCTFTQLFIPSWNIRYTEDVTLYTVIKVGGSMGQGPATEVIQLIS